MPRSLEISALPGANEPIALRILSEDPQVGEMMVMYITLETARAILTSLGNITMVVTTTGASMTIKVPLHEPDAPA